MDTSNNTVFAKTNETLINSLITIISSTANMDTSDNTVFAKAKTKNQGNYHNYYSSKNFL